jgi:hypothetical protein
MDNFTFIVVIIISFIIVLSLLWLFIGGGDYKFEGLQFLDPPVANPDDSSYEEVTSGSSENKDESCHVEILEVPEVPEIPQEISKPEECQLEYIPAIKFQLPSLEIEYYENFILTNQKTGKHMNKKTASESRGEKLCRNILEKFFNKPFPTCRPDFLVNTESNANLELDCYNEELNLAVEYNGAQHYNYPNKFHKTEEEFKEQLRRDALKKQICQDRGIYLLIVPYWIPHGHIPKFIEYYLPENVFYRRENGITEQTEEIFWGEKAPNFNPHGYT